MKDEDLCKMRKIIKITLIKIGFRVDLTGFSYLCYAIELVILDPTLIHGLCKKLYVLVGKKFEVHGDSCVERNIRHAIDNTYTSRSFLTVNKLFDADLFTINEKPTCGELIKLIAEYYNLDLYKTHVI